MMHGTNVKSFGVSCCYHLQDGSPKTMVFGM